MMRGSSRDVACHYSTGRREREGLEGEEALDDEQGQFKQPALPKTITYVP